jgi:outer membrane protein, multidrug efflux system
MRKLIIPVIAGLSLVACKVQQAPVKSLLEMPVTYHPAADTSYRMEGAWKQQFTDTRLQGLIDTALHANLDLAMAVQRIEMARAGLHYARGLNKPFVGVGVTAGLRRFSEYSMDGVGNYDTNFSPNIREDQKMARDLPDYQVGFQAAWEVDVWGKLRNKRKASQARYLASVEGRAWVETTLVAEVASLYYELIALERQLALLQVTNDLQEKGLEVIRLQKETGGVNELAVNQFEAQLYNFQALAMSTSRARVMVENQLNFLMGRYPQPISLDVAALDKDAVLPMATGGPSQLMQRRPDVRQAEWELQATKADVKAARAAFYPSLDWQGLLGMHSFNASTWTNPSSLTYQVFGSLMAPVLNRSGLQAELQFSKATQEEAFLMYQKTLMQAYLEVFDQTLAMDNLQGMAELKTLEVDALMRAVDNARQLFATGRANYLEVVIAQKNALQARLELIEAQKLRHQAFVNLYKALGGG